MSFYRSHHVTVLCGTLIKRISCVTLVVECYVLKLTVSLLINSECKYDLKTKKSFFVALFSVRKFVQILLFLQMENI